MTAAVFARGMLLHDTASRPIRSSGSAARRTDSSVRPSTSSCPKASCCTACRSSWTWARCSIAGSSTPSSRRMLRAPSRGPFARAAALHRLPTGGEGLLQQDRYLSHHAHHRVSPRLPGQPVGRHEPLRSLHQGEAVGVAQLVETDALKLTLPWVVAEIEETRRVMGHDFWARHRAEPRIVRGAAAVFARTEA